MRGGGAPATFVLEREKGKEKREPSVLSPFPKRENTEREEREREGERERRLVVCREEDTEAEAIGISRKYIYWKSVEVGFLEHTHHTVRREKRAFWLWRRRCVCGADGSKGKRKERGKGSFSEGESVCAPTLPFLGARGGERKIHLRCRKVEGKSSPCSSSTILCGGALRWS